jgi:hypothetical protein
MSLPISLTDSELDAVMAAARPLAPCDRDAFLQHIAQVLTTMPMRGPGSVHRAIAELQRRYFVDPDLRVGTGKH